MIFMMFLLMMIMRVMEIVFVKTDQTWIGENIYHKIGCILLIWIVLALRNWHWSDLGFSKKGIIHGLKYGLGLGISVFFFAYAVEFIILYTMGKHPSLQCYVTNFSLSQNHNNGCSLAIIALCVIGNLINVWAEEGLFRGLFLKMGMQCYSQKTANRIQALLFGIWHITNVIYPVLTGSMSITAAILMGSGYVLLSAVLAYEWGLCAALSGTLWVGASQHLFNNFISNFLHTVSETGVDEMMVLRIILSNMLSFVVVLIIAQKKKSKLCE